jgi:hypothetical protein
MATATMDAKKKKLDCFHKIFASTGCTGTCVYKYDSQTGEYILQPGQSSCAGTGCSSCATMLPNIIRKLVILAGNRVFPDPDHFSYSCGVTREVLLERLLTEYVEHLKLKTRHRIVIAFSVVLGILAVAGGILAYVLSR